IVGSRYRWPAMIDVRLVRESQAAVEAALARRGIEPAEVERVAELDRRHRAAVGHQEGLRAQVKSLSRQVGQARKSGDAAQAERLAAESRALGEEERKAAEEEGRLGTELRQALLVLPNLPAEEAP